MSTQDTCLTHFSMYLSLQHLKCNLFPRGIASSPRRVAVPGSHSFFGCSRPATTILRSARSRPAAYYSPGTYTGSGCTWMYRVSRRFPTSFVPPRPGHPAPPLVIRRPLVPLFFSSYSLGLRRLLIYSRYRFLGWASCDSAAIGASGREHEPDDELAGIRGSAKTHSALDGERLLRARKHHGEIKK